jgi:hypothetical protein
MLIYVSLLLGFIVSHFSFMEEEDSNETDYVGLPCVFTVSWLDFDIFIDSILSPGWKCEAFLKSVAGASKYDQGAHS